MWDRAGRLGIPCRIIPGIMPIVNYRQIVRITRLCGATIPAALSSRLEPVADDPDASLEIGIEWGAAAVRRTTRKRRPRYPLLYAEPL